MPYHKTRPSLTEARQKAEKYCAYQERSHKEVFGKLRLMGLSENEANDILVQLIQNNFVNEERFAHAFAGGKFRTKKWGKRKIMYEMKAKGLNDNLIQMAVGAISDSVYKETLVAELHKKNGLIKEKDRAVRMAKISKYLFGKGYEHNLVIEEVKKYYNP